MEMDDLFKAGSDIMRDVSQAVESGDYSHLSGHAEAAGLQIRLRSEGDRERANQGVALFAGVRCG